MILWICNIHGTCAACVPNEGVQEGSSAYLLQVAVSNMPKTCWLFVSLQLPVTGWILIVLSLGRLGLTTLGLSDNIPYTYLALPHMK